MACNLYFLKTLQRKHGVESFDRLPVHENSFWLWRKPLVPKYAESHADGLLDGRLMIKGTMQLPKALHAARIVLDISSDEFGLVEESALINHEGSPPRPAGY